MPSQRLGLQTDLFASSDGGASCQVAFEPAPQEFVDRIRAELYATLARVRDAATLPWSDLTQSLLAELRFKSIANWLPEAEADQLRQDFEFELRRLYEDRDAAALVEIGGSKNEQ